MEEKKVFNFYQLLKEQNVLLTAAIFAISYKINTTSGIIAELLTSICSTSCTKEEIDDKVKKIFIEGVRVTIALMIIYILSYLIYNYD